MSTLDLTPTVRRSLTLVLEGGPLVVLGEAQGLSVELGRRGPQGAPGSAGAAYMHTQSVPASTWTVPHNLGVRPAVAVVDGGGNEIEADVIHLTANTLQILFAAPTAGAARLV